MKLPQGEMHLGAVGWDPAGADPCGGCRGRRRAGRGRRRCQQGKESLGEQQTLSQDRLCACRHLWALLPGGGRGIAEQQICAKRCGSFWGLLGPLKFPYLKRQERGERRCVMVSDLSMGYVCFSHPSRGFSESPSTSSSSPFPIITSCWLPLCSPLTPCPLGETHRAPRLRVNVSSLLQTAPMPGSHGVV